jgi:hypothetical protein
MGGGGRNEESPQPLLRQIRTKLFTREDNTNIHKTLGVTCLLSYLWHFVRVGEGDMGFTNTYSTPMVIALHLLLSVSSIIFRIPAKRIVSGYRIWPEYRLHSIMFACRSLACMLLTWVEAQQGWAPEYRANAVICLATIAAADLSSYMVGPAGRSSTIRDLEAGPATHFFFSAMQFHATMGCMLGVRRYSTQFIYVWIIQFNAFLMTLRRKNLAGHTALVTTYGFMLAFGYMVSCGSGRPPRLTALLSTSHAHHAPPPPHTPPRKCLRSDAPCVLSPVPISRLACRSPPTNSDVSDCSLWPTFSATSLGSCALDSVCQSIPSG